MHKALRLIYSTFGLMLLIYSSAAAQSAQSTVQEALIVQLLDTKNCEGCDLRGADLTGALLIGANLAGANLDNANLSGARLSDADMRGVSFVRANLQGAILNGADLSNADLDGANIGGGRLFETILANSNLSGADLRYAQLRNTDLTGANMTNANLGNANVNGWKDDGTIFCRTIEPNGTPINRDCEVPEQAIAQTGQNQPTDAPRSSGFMEFPSAPRLLVRRDADWSIISDVARAQRLLSKLGYEPGTVDGLWGARTRQALRRFFDDRADDFDGSLDDADLVTLEAAASEKGISAHPQVEWEYRATSIMLGGYEAADDPIYDLLRTIRDLPDFGFNVLTIDFRCTGWRELGLPDGYPIGRQLGCSISNRQVLQEDGFASTRRDATNLAIDEAHAAGLAVNLKPMFLELGRRFGDPDAAGFGIMPVDVFFDGDGKTWSGYRSVILGVAEYAKENDVEYLTIGTELNNLNSQIESDARWSEIIPAIRSVYDGKLIYAHGYGNDSDLRRLASSNLMQLVNIAGLNYFPTNLLGTRKDYTSEEISLAFDRFRLESGRGMMEEAELFSQNLELPVILSETTFPTWRGSANWMFRGGCDYQNEGRRGWQYTQGPLQPKTPSDEHGRLLAAGFMLAFEDEAWVYGADYLYWSVSHAFDERTDFSEYGPCSSWLWNSDDGIRELIRDFHAP